VLINEEAETSVPTTKATSLDTTGNLGIGAYSILPTGCSNILVKFSSKTYVRSKSFSFSTVGCSSAIKPITSSSNFTYAVLSGCNKSTLVVSNVKYNFNIYVIHSTMYFINYIFT